MNLQYFLLHNLLVLLVKNYPDHQGVTT